MKKDWILPLDCELSNTMMGECMNVGSLRCLPTSLKLIIWRNWRFDSFGVSKSQEVHLGYDNNNAEPHPPRLSTSKQTSKSVRVSWLRTPLNIGSFDFSSLAGLYRTHYCHCFNSSILFTPVVGVTMLLFWTLVASCSGTDADLLISMSIHFYLSSIFHTMSQTGHPPCNRNMHIVSLWAISLS